MCSPCTRSQSLKFAFRRLDIVAWAATTKAGKALGLDAVHRALNARRNATITCVLERIDMLEQKIDGKLK